MSDPRLSHDRTSLPFLLLFCWKVHSYGVSGVRLPVGNGIRLSLGRLPAWSLAFLHISCS